MRLSTRTRAITLEVILRAVFGVQAERMSELARAIGQLAEPMRPLMMLRLMMSRPTGDRPPVSLARRWSGWTV